MAEAWKPDLAPALRAWIGLGANLGRPAEALASARQRLGDLPLTCEAGASSLHASRPVDAGGPDYVNAVVCLDTLLGPRELMTALLAIEQAHHRERPWPNAPRTLDLDLLWFEGFQLDTPFLTLPHPRMAERAFVQCPLAELCEAMGLPAGPGRPLLLPPNERQALALAQGIERLSAPW